MQKLVVPINLINVGKTPALKLAVNSYAEVLNNSQSPSLSYPTSYPDVGISTTVGMMFQNTSSEVPIGTNKSITETQRTSITDGASYIVFYGNVEYFDIFGRIHETRFCWMEFFAGLKKITSINARTCTDYNYTDPN
jgi:hypothetical protein